MPALNRIQLIGYLGKDPESKYTPTGRRVTDFSLGISTRWRDDSGEKREHTEWVTVETWGRLAEVCHEYLKKGSLVYVEGRLRTDRYEAEGEARHFTKVVAQTVQFLDSQADVEALDPPDEAGEKAPEMADVS